MDHRGAFFRLMGSSKFWVALGGVVAAVGVLFGVSADKTAEAIAVISAIGVLAGLYIAATGYEDGKQAEAFGIVAASGRQAEADLSSAVCNHVLLNPKEDEAATVEALSNIKKTDPECWRKMMAAISKVPVFLIALAVLSGCRGTSEPFKLGVAPAMREVAMEYRVYVVADEKISAEEKTTRMGDANRLVGAVASHKNIRFELVDEAYGRVRPPYVAYVEADSTLRNNADKAAVLGTVAELDTLMEAERKRKAQLWPLSLLFP